MLKKILTGVFILTIAVFVVSIYFLVFQVIGIDKTILSGILSMIGGFAGALGAYIVAMYQMKKQFEHEKKKDEKQKLEQMLLFLIKLKKLNENIVRFIVIFRREFDGIYSEKIVYKLKIREHDLLWIINKVEEIDDAFLKEEFNVEYFDFSAEVHHMYVDFIGFKYLSEDLQSIHLKTLYEAVVNRKDAFISFNEYLKEQIEKYSLDNKSHST